MAFDNFTPHRYRVLKETPRGDQPGSIITETEDVGNILISVGVVEQLPDESDPSPRGSYKRRDLRAER